MYSCLKRSGREITVPVTSQSSRTYNCLKRSGREITVPVTSQSSRTYNCLKRSGREITVPVAAQRGRTYSCLRRTVGETDCACYWDVKQVTKQSLSTGRLFQPLGPVTLTPTSGQLPTRIRVQVIVSLSLVNDYHSIGFNATSLGQFQRRSESHKMSLVSCFID